MTRDSTYKLDIDGAALARKSMEIPKVKRFYKEVAVGDVDGRFCILLDDRPLKTPGKTKLVVSREVLAEMVRDEWVAQNEFIEAHTMPVTRLVSTAIDSVQENRSEIVEETAGYAGSDLLCYRAESPIELIDLQAENWDPVLDWARDELDAPFEVTSGVVHVSQPHYSLNKIKQHIEILDVFTLSAAASMTNLLGSVLLALAVIHGNIEPDAAWSAAHVDEDWQARNWGADDEAEERRATRWLEMTAAARVATVR